MSSIYSAAHLTIIAAAGEDPSYGLPGVSGLLSHKTHQHEVVGCTCLVTPGGTDQQYEEVEESRWFSRAWTFQECYSSRRRLFFTNRTVFYVCNSPDRSEGINVNSGFRRFYDCLPSNADQIFYPDQSYQMFRRLELYTSRQLTYDSDALDAILSTLESFANFTHPVYHIWAIPVYIPIYQAGLPQIPFIALGFCHLQPCRRRHGFPSWSVLGWDGPAKWYNSESKVEMSGFSLVRSPASSGVISLLSYFMDHSSTNVAEQPRYIKTRVWGKPASFARLEKSMGHGFEGNFIALALSSDCELLLEPYWDTLPSDGSTLLLTSLAHAPYTMLILEKDERCYQRVGIQRLWNPTLALTRHRETGEIIDTFPLSNHTLKDWFGELFNCISSVDKGNMTIVIG